MTDSVMLNITPLIQGRISALGKLGSVGEDVNQPANQPFLQLLAGTGLGQCDTFFEDLRTLAASASENLDLSGTLLNRFGETIAFAHVKLLYIEADPANTNSVILGGAASNTALLGFGAATHTWAVAPGECMLSTFGKGAGWPVTAATADLLKVLNGGSGTVVNYKVLICGTSV